GSLRIFGECLINSGLTLRCQVAHKRTNKKIHARADHFPPFVYGRPQARPRQGLTPGSGRAIAFHVADAGARNAPARGKTARQRRDRSRSGLSLPPRIPGAAQRAAARCRIRARYLTLPDHRCTVAAIVNSRNWAQASWLVTTSRDPTAVPRPGASPVS